MIVAGTYPPISIDLGNDEPSMTLQREYREDGWLVWRDVVVDGQVVKSPVDIDALPFGVNIGWLILHPDNHYPQ